MRKALSILMAMMIALLLFTGCDDNKDVAGSHDRSEDSHSYFQTDKPSVTPTIKPTEAATEASPIIESSHTIYEILSPFNGGKAWVSYKTGNELNYALIDTDGYFVWSVAGSDLGQWGQCKGLSTTDDTYCIFPDNTVAFHYSPGMIIINAAGTIQFDSRNAPEDTTYYYLGYGDNIYLAIKWVKNFSLNEYFIVEIDKNGRLLNELPWPKSWTGPEPESVTGANYHLNQNFTYCGNDIFIGTQNYTPWGGPVWYYDKQKKSFYCARDKFSPQAYLTEVISDNETLLRVYLSGLSGFEFTSEYCIIDTKLLHSAEAKINIDQAVFELLGENYGEKLFNCIGNSYRSRDFDPGVYDYRGNLLHAYPKEWTITDGDAFSEGYASLQLKGADNENYLVIVDKKAKPAYEPIKVDSVVYPSWHGYVMVRIDNQEIIISPEGEKIDRQELDTQYGTYTLGNIQMVNGYEKVYNKTTEKYDTFRCADGSTIFNIYKVINYSEIKKNR